MHNSGLIFSRYFLLHKTSTFSWNLKRALLSFMANHIPADVFLIVFTLVWWVFFFYKLLVLSASALFVIWVTSVAILSLFFLLQSSYWLRFSLLFIRNIFFSSSSLWWTFRCLSSSHYVLSLNILHCFFCFLFLHDPSLCIISSFFFLTTLTVFLCV